MFKYESAREFCSVLSDDTSRFLYEKRCMWSLTGDEKYVDDIVDSMIDKQALGEMLDKAKQVSDKLLIRGTGNEYGTLMRLCPELEFRCFVDRDKMRVEQGEIFEHKVISLDEYYSDYRNYYVIVCSSAFCDEIIAEMKEHGIEDEYILPFGNLCQCNKQYFDTDIITPIQHEVFVDGGCFDGSTIRNFVTWCDGKYDSIYSYEPDHMNYELTLNNLKNNPIENVTLFNKGLWDKPETLYFYETGGQGSGIVSEDNEEFEKISIETTSIDESVESAPVTFIKLDVEGAEYEALVGASKTIEKYHPRMAISIYHKPEDIFTLPKLLMDMSNDYRFYLRHYQMSRFETILYVV